MKSIILSDKLIDALEAAGIIPDRRRVRRVIIDAKAGEPVRLYVCCFGDERLIDVVEEGGVELIHRD